MGSGKRKKKPKIGVHVEVNKKPKIQRFPDNAPDDKHVHFRYRFFDDGLRLSDGSPDCFYSIGSKLRSLATQGWGGIKANKDKHHSVAIGSLTKAAKDRLIALKYDDLDRLFSMRLSGTQRLWGIQVGNAFYVLWWDPCHRVCPSNKRNT